MALESFLYLALLKITCLGNSFCKLYFQNVEAVIVLVHETKNERTQEATGSRRWHLSIN